MELTRHAKIRRQQRGVSDEMLKIVIDYGRYSSAPGGAEKIRFGKKEYQLVSSKINKIINRLNRGTELKDIDYEDLIITSYI